MFKANEVSYGVLAKRRLGILKKMAKVGPFIMATPTYLKVRCGYPDCKCAGPKEDRHEKLHLSWGDAQGQGTAYVPVDLREEVLQWIENYWTVKEYMKEMTELSRQMIKMYARTIGRVKRQQRKAALLAKTGKAKI
ncbi:MAG: hypothetical protein HQL23_02030 [Candidatus Omnitrophica bacterium]|nr:hypothetical protein [Candidatus Omnitrophota bacterium]